MTSAARQGHLLNVRDLTRHFGGVSAVDGIDLELDAGEILGVIGPNGAGKSTLMGLLGGAVRPTRGTVHLEGDDVTSLDATGRARRGIARTFQIPHPFSGLTVYENVEVASYHRYSQMLGGVNEVLDFCDLGRIADSRVDTLTHADLRRLEFARALALGPRLLLLDELGAGLIAHELDRFSALIREVHGMGVGIVVVEHVMRLVMNISDRILVIDRGKMIALDTPDAVKTNEKVVSAYLGSEDVY